LENFGLFDSRPTLKEVDGGGQVVVDEGSVELADLENKREGVGIWENAFHSFNLFHQLFQILNKNQTNLKNCLFFGKLVILIS
jgi:hypothetical protein